MGRAERYDLGTLDVSRICLLIMELLRDAAPKKQPYGNGVLLWFRTNEFDAAVERVIAFGAQILEQT
jgi:hypothetical protein